MVPPAPDAAPSAPQAPPPPGTLIRRHAVATRLWHWTNAIAFFILLGSGLGISNAHPRLYWGRYGANFDHAWATLPRFPAWLTIPSSYNLAISRRWHLFFALVFAFGLAAFMVASIANRHFRRLRLTRADVSPAHLAADVRDHWNFRFHDARDPGAYNSLQKWSYILVLFVALPAMILTGLALSPGMDAAWPWLLDVTGGRQSARSIHFIAASLLGGFAVVHLVLVILAGAGNELRSMLSGWWKVPE
ncbi:MULTISPECIES: cytochrome b/b6 domain-containing protein [unclassified Sphingomonas]|jgi:thiosulfate reductase cytochrome b subunit|uniref:cytochrome b/b6 domain-containing protein n=1 Tax=unclassified Sphingomonas TaxID=196159 RepID=UPI00286F38FF|nr:cytochrome b/b6 domain-containing protein [Sphingomonas sp.]